MKIYQRANQIIEIQYGNSVTQSSDACSQHNFKQTSARYFTLTSELLEFLFLTL
jgi:hypothetical protein